MMRARGLLLLCGLCLVATGISGQLDSSSVDGGLSFAPRFTRLLKQDLSSVATYLLPTKQPDLCTTDCCQADSYASPYQLRYLNSTQRDIGGRTYTTFFYTLDSQKSCQANIDDAGCCSASADTIWVDVDPTLKVVYVAFDGKHVLGAQQGDNGLKVGGLSKAFGQIPAAGVSMAVTIDGAADALCPPPGLAPLAGLCEVVVEGVPASGSGVCCPVSVTRTSKDVMALPDTSFQCNANLAASGFEMLMDGVSAPSAADADGSRYVTYNFRLAASSTCDRSSVSHCCDAQLLYINLRVTDLPIMNVTLNGQRVAHLTSSWNEPNTASYRSLTIEDLQLMPDDVGVAGMVLAVMVRVPGSATATPRDLCDASADPYQGFCAFYLHSLNGFCCPSGLALGDVPPPPAGTCDNSVNVPASSTSLSLQYYEKSGTSASTTFAFLLANHNGAGCTKAHCVDICSWTLYTRGSLSNVLAIGHESSANNGKQVISTTPVAGVTFMYGPTGESATNFYLTMPSSGATLSDLCAPNVLPGQNGKACAAIVRSQHVFFMVFFDESDVVLGPTTPPQPALCPSAQPLASSCLAVTNARYNMQPATTVVDVALGPSSSGTCLRASPAGQAVNVRLMLTSAAVDQISTRMQVLPSTGLSLDRINGAKWALGQAAARLGFQLQGAMGVADVCRQGVTADQPAGTCVVEVSGSSGCFRGYVAPSADNRLTWGDGAEQGSGGGVATSTIVPAVVLPILLLLVLLVLAAVYYRRRQRAAAYAPASLSGSSQDALQRPLAGSVSGSLQRDDVSVPSAAPSDVHVRVRGSHGGAQ